MLVLMILFALTAFISPVSIDAAGEDTGRDSESQTAISAVVSLLPARHIALLSPRRAGKTHIPAHLRSRTSTRRSGARSLESPWGAILVVFSFISPRVAMARSSHLRLIMQVPEYLRGHIGEKRFADGACAPAIFALILGCLMTAFSVAPSFLLSHRPQWTFHGRLRFPVGQPAFHFAGWRDMF
jgi:hypothetical protein